MAKFGRALIADRFEAQQMIQEAIENSMNLAEAMECVGAMYGIPSSNILVDDKLKSVKVINDNIICPSNVGAKSNENTIVRSIGAVLDQISSRIDDKLNGIQSENIERGRESDEVASKSDPSKGKVVATYKDANGDILLVYDSGIIDAPQTPEGRAKADEIRAAGNAPTLNPLPKNTPSYFSDEDNVMNGVTPEQPAMEYSLADMIGEESYFLDAMAKFGDTPNLGHAILTYHGYECVQPTMNLVQEATVNKKSISPDDIKYMKFDNSEIYKAIECFNKCRENQSYIKHVEDLDIETFVRDKNFQEGVRHLDNQFDCKIALKWVHAGKKASSAYTMIFPTEYRTKLTVSKSKGFQLGGAPIYVTVVEDGITELITNRQDLFGQSFTSVILHEIFHNIAGIIRYENAQFVSSITVAMEEASRARDPKLRTMIIEKYVDTLNSQLNGKLGKVSKKLVTNRLLALVSAKSDARMLSQYQDALDKDSDKNGINEEANKRVKRSIAIYKRGLKEAEKPIKQARARGVGGVVGGGIAIVAGVVGALLIKSSFGIALSIALGIIGAGAITDGIVNFASVSKYEKLMKKYKDSKELEEYYADLMSGMYQLPQHFFIGGKIGNKRYQFNEIEQETVDEWVKIEKALYEAFGEKYPTMSERTWTGVTIAKKVLECKHLDKNVEKYLKWIVENNDKILKSGIETHDSHSFEPEAAQDLDKHLSDLIKKNNIQVTESAIRELVDSTDVAIWIENGMPYSDDEIAFQEACDLMNRCESIFQEIYTSRKTTGYADESLIKRILMFIPRLIANCLEIIWRFSKSVIQSDFDLIYKIFTPNKIYTINFNIEWALILVKNYSIFVDKMYDVLDGAKDIKDFIERCEKIEYRKLFTDMDDEELEKLGKDNIDSLRFKGWSGNLKEDEEIHISGKTLCDDIVEIHKLGNRMTPKLRRLLDQTTRLSKTAKDSNPIENLTEEQKRLFNTMIGCYKDIYLSYNRIYRWIYKFKRKKTSKEDVAKSIGKDES